MDDLIVRQKCEDMIRYGYVALRQFPKYERHVLNQEIRRTMWSVLRLIIVCNKRYYKKTTLQELDSDMELLRTQVRMAMQLEYLAFKKYEVWSRMLDEIGRLIGGWIKSCRG